MTGQSAALFFVDRLRGRGGVLGASVGAGVGGSAQQLQRPGEALLHPHRGV